MRVRGGFPELVSTPSRTCPAFQDAPHLRRAHQRLPQATPDIRRRRYVPPTMRLIVARCSVEYSGRLSARLPEALRLVMLKADGSVLVHADAGGYKPLNWMTPPTVIEEEDGRDRGPQAQGRGPAGDHACTRCSPTSTTRWTRTRRGWRRTAWSATCRSCWPTRRSWCGEGFRLVRREWPTDIGPVDLMCRDERGRLDRGRDQADRDDRRRRAAVPLPRADPAGPGDGRLRAACWRRRSSSRRRACWRRRAGWRGSRSTWRSCAASASLRLRCSGHERAARPHRGRRRRPR